MDGDSEWAIGVIEGEEEQKTERRKKREQNQNLEGERRIRERSSLLYDFIIQE
ncbi:Phosphoserine aminotransferase [Bienertia sinuspersici]